MTDTSAPLISTSLRSIIFIKADSSDARTRTHKHVTCLFTALNFCSRRKFFVARETQE
jgi:hypothetical protein